MSEETVKDPNTFEVSVHDSVGVAELTPGGAAKQSEPEKPLEGRPLTDEDIAKMSPEEVMKRVLERKVALASEYVAPHNKAAREVTVADLPRVINDARVMYEMCLVGRADYTTAYAIAHTQVNDEDPLRFYVTIEGQIIINPVIVKHNQEFETKNEGCMSFPSEPMKPVMRYKKVTLEYQTITYKEKEGVPVGDPELSPRITTKYYNHEAKVVQHECQHLNGHNIYDKDANAGQALENASPIDKI